jgi:hypothetical protein
MPIVDEIASVLTGSVFDGVAKIVTLFKIPPEQALQHQEQIQKIANDMQSKILDSVTAQIQAVNATMQAESKSEHWAQWLWRPVIGFTFAVTILNDYVLYSYFAKFGMQKIDIPGDVWSAMLVVLGAAAVTRGWQKITEAGKGNNG